MITWPWLLAATPDEEWIKLVTYAIGGVIVVGGWVINHLRQMAEKRAAEERARRKLEEFGRQGATSAASGRPKDMPTADDLAMQRRRQLQELAQQRRQATDPPRPTSPTPEPDNLTLSQARERQRAVEAYRRRAEALEQQRRQRPARIPPGAKPQGSSIRPASRRPAPAQPSRPTSQTPPPPREQLARREVVSAVGAVASRHIRPALASPLQAAVASPVTADAGRAPFSLRQAILWKEILDQPVALRDVHLV